MQQWMYSVSFKNFNELSYRDPPISRCRRRSCSDGSCKRCKMPRCRTPYVQQWVYSPSFPNFNVLSCRYPPISWWRRHGCSDESGRRCRMPLQSIEVPRSLCNSGFCKGCRLLLLNAVVQSVVCVAKNPRSRIYKPLTSNLKDPQDYSNTVW